MVSSLRNVSEELARTLAASLGLELPPAMPRAIDAVPGPEVERSASLSLLARPGDVGPQARRVAILVGPGVDGARATRIHDALSAQGAVPRFLGTRLGTVASTTGEPLAVEATLETSPSALWDAVVVCAEALADAFADSPPVVELVQSQYRHGKPILVVGEGAALLDAAGVPATLPSGEQDPGLVRGVDVDAAVTAFVRALSTHRVYAREDLRPAA